MNSVDLIIIVFLFFAVMRGFTTGLIQLLLSSAGIVLGMILGSWLGGWMAQSVTNPFNKFLVVAVALMWLTALFGTIGEVAGIKLNILVRRLRLGGLDQLLGTILAVIFAVVIVWLTAAALINVREYGIGSAIRQSVTVRKINAILPSPPDIFAQLEKIISPNGFPNVFRGLEPQHTTVSPSNSINNRAVIADEASTVKIQGRGCGGKVSGSGFVVANGMVVTNAHVVAGISSPEVVDESGTSPAVPILFDPDMDVAVLRVSGLTDPPLKLSDQALADNDAAAILGFPGGGPLVAGSGVVIDQVTAAGSNIYNRSLVFRSIYEVQGDVEPGNSGGPLVAPDGSVAGIVFAKSISQSNVGYALTISEVRPIILKAIENDTPTGTAGCAPIG